jgi:undecaprenyl pyrophosphate phosphatase UppP
MWEQTVRKFTIRLCVIGVLLGVIFLLVYRYCEQFGILAQKGCILAVISSFLAGGLSLWPFFRMLKEDQETLLLSIIWAISLRMLISFSLITVTLLFMNISSEWFLGCYGLFYGVFIILDSWLMLLLAGDVSLRKKEVEYDYL